MCTDHAAAAVDWCIDSFRCSRHRKSRNSSPRQIIITINTERIIISSIFSHETSMYVSIVPVSRRTLQNVYFFLIYPATVGPATCVCELAVGVNSEKCRMCIEINRTKDETHITNNDGILYFSSFCVEITPVLICFAYAVCLRKFCCWRTKREKRRRK